MKHKIYYFGILLGVFYLTSCSKDKAPEKVSGVLEFAAAGNHTFKIEAKDIQATIMLVGAGGGGGGGVVYNSGSSTGGGGGAGAGEVKVFGNVNLQENVQYTVLVGAGGEGGNASLSGKNGQKSEISLLQIPLYTALPGKGGLSNSPNSTPGGNGGEGFPSGNKGGSGEILDATWSGKAGVGGTGGDNLSSKGKGGNGGNGCAISNNEIESSPQAGMSGANGYVRIEWVGIK
jgi:hypothetical protein